MELEFYGTLSIDGDIESTPSIHSLNQQSDTNSSDSHSGDLLFDDDIDFIALDGNGGDLTVKTPAKDGKSVGRSVDLGFEPIGLNDKATSKTNSLDVMPSSGLKHYRSHSDSGLVQKCNNMRESPTDDDARNEIHGPIEAITAQTAVEAAAPNSTSQEDGSFALICPPQRLSAKIINTAINRDGQYAVYSIQITIIEENQQKSWHVYRRYSRFLDLKKLLVKRVSNE